MFIISLFNFSLLPFCGKRRKNWESVNRLQLFLHFHSKLSFHLHIFFGFNEKLQFINKAAGTRKKEINDVFGVAKLSLMTNKRKGFEVLEITSKGKVVKSCWIGKSVFLFSYSDFVVICIIMWMRFRFNDNPIKKEKLKWNLSDGSW